MKEKIKIGVLIDSLILQNWIIWILDKLSTHDNIQFDFIVINKNKQTTKKKSSFSKKFFMLILFLEKKILWDNLNELHESAYKIPTNVKIYNEKADKKGIGYYFTKNTIINIKSHKPDLILRFGFGILRGELLNIPKYGVWSYHHGDNKFNRGKPSCFYEILHGEHREGAILQKLNNQLDNGKVIDRVHTKVINNSMLLTMNQLFKSSKQMMINNIVKLYNDKAINSIDNLPIMYDRPLYKIPTIINLLSYIKILLISKYKSYKKSDRRMNWALLFGVTSEGQHPLSIPMYKLREIKAPKGFFWADPFIRKINTGYEIFLEEFCLSNCKGVIKKIKIDKRANIIEQSICIDEPWHLSYPFIFKEKDDYYMIPESSQNNKLIIYKENKENNKWKVFKVLFDEGNLFDATVYKEGEKFWIFVNRSGFSERPDQELFIYHTNDILKGNLTGHINNPVKIDIASSRPAGNLFTYKNNLFRPSQNCSKYYGGELKINKVINLNNTQYEEEVYRTLSPFWNNNYNSLHTVNFCEDAIVYDVNLKK